jgi:hypothetical protein
MTTAAESVGLRQLSAFSPRLARGQDRRVPGYYGRFFSGVAVCFLAVSSLPTIVVVVPFLFVLMGMLAWAMERSSRWRHSASLRISNSLQESRAQQGRTGRILCCLGVWCTEGYIWKLRNWTALGVLMTSFPSKRQAGAGKVTVVIPGM